MSNLLHSKEISALLNKNAITNKNTLILFTAPNCSWCQTLKSQIDKTFTDTLEQNNISFHIIELPTKSDEEQVFLSCESGACTLPPLNYGLRKRYNITSLPLLVLFSTANEEMYRTGYKEPKSLLSSILSAVTSDTDL